MSGAVQARAVKITTERSRVLTHRSYIQAAEVAGFGLVYAVHGVCTGNLRGLLDAIAKTASRSDDKVGTYTGKRKNCEL